MAPRSFSTEGIVISRKNYGEADRVLLIFSKHYGKMFLLAKGVRKPKSRKRGHIEIFSQVKYSFTKNDHFVLMNEAELIDSYDEIRISLQKTSLAYYFIEIIGKILQEDERQELLYQILITYLNLLKTSHRLKDLRLNYIYDVLVNLGYWPKGKEILDHDNVIESVLERQINSKRVGKKLLKYSR
jgi:DNA repair protein RecO (recombination protein O)